MNSMKYVKRTIWKSCVWKCILLIDCFNQGCGSKVKDRLNIRNCANIFRDVQKEISNMYIE